MGQTPREGSSPSSSTRPGTAAMKEFNADGVSFSYPDNWTLEREEADDGWVVTVHSPGTAFAVFRLDHDMPDPRKVVHDTLEAMRSEFPELEAESALEM